MSKIKNRSTSVRTGATPTKERRLQNGGVVYETIKQDAQGKPLIGRYRAVWECPLDVYRDYKVINEAQYKAGLRFHEAYYGAVICRTEDLGPVSHNRASFGVTRHDEWLKQAYSALPSETVDTVVDICGHSNPAFSPRALDTLRKGLGHLAVRWHMAAIEVCDHKTVK